MAKRTFVTKKKLSGVKTEYRAWKDWAEGDILIGTLVGSAQNRKNKSKKDWIVKVEEAMFADKKDMKRLKPGTTLTLNCAGQLDKGMEQVEMGEMFQVTYNGQVEMKGGEYAGELAHTMEVELVGEEGEESEEETEEEEEEESEEYEEDDL